MKWNRTIPAVLITLFVMTVPVSVSAMTTTRIVSGLDRPLFVCSPPNDYARVFILEQRGRIRIYKNGTLLARSFLDIDAISSCCGERGLLGLAFHPQYAQNGYFYVNYTNNSGNTVVARYSVSGTDPDSAVSTSALILKTITQPESNHNGGCLQFGPDGMLYIGMGDGGGANDQHGTIGNGQNPSTLLGKLLRLNVDTAAPYVPADNPHVGAVDTLPEIWAHGLRNPWRFSFDRTLGHLYIADVGQGRREEVDFQNGSSTGGENYGWRCMEADSCTGMSGCACSSAVLTMPIHVYTHNDGCSITGGYVYRGCAIPGLGGSYLFGDYCAGRTWALVYDGSTLTGFRELTDTLDPPGVLVINQISSYGEDAFGEIYICDYFDGEVYKIIPDAITDCNLNGRPDTCEILYGLVGDTNGNGVPDPCEVPCVCPCHGDPVCDGLTDVLDVVAAVAEAFRNSSGVTDPGCRHSSRSDVNCDCLVDVLDVVAIVGRAFRNEQTPFCDPCVQPCG